ncbi:MAG: hypothetical protein AAGJ91_15635 [Pseudomonadota bacterium]
MRPILAEALGTFWIVLTSGGLIAQGLVTPGLGAGAAAGLAYLSVALTLGQITVGHFNPALTIGLRLVDGFGGSLSLTLAAQLGGAVLALLIVGAPPEPTTETAPGVAMLLLVPLVALPVLIHVAGMQLRPSDLAYANAVALVAAVSLAPGGHAAMNAAHATASWATGDGAPNGLWRMWLATGVAVSLAAWIWRKLQEDTAVEDDMSGDGGMSERQKVSEKHGMSEEEGPNAVRRAEPPQSEVSSSAWAPFQPKGRVPKNTPLKKRKLRHAERPRARD